MDEKIEAGQPGPAATQGLLFQELLEGSEHRFPILFGMIACLFGRIIVLGQREQGLIALPRQLNGYGVIV
ncbi:MAG: hypothetical protein WA628_10115, partial [Terriglobales bacterium]